MENILEECQTGSVNVLYLTYLWLIILTVLNLLVLAGTFTSNSLVIFSLIKTKQIFKVSWKLIFHLSVSLFLAVLFETVCIVKVASQFFSGFLVRLFAYTIGLIGIDHFICIKYKMTFRSILTSKSVMFVLLLVCFPCFDQCNDADHWSFSKRKSIRDDCISSWHYCIIFCYYHATVNNQGYQKSK